MGSIRIRVFVEHGIDVGRPWERKGEGGSEERQDGLASGRRESREEGEMQHRRAALFLTVEDEKPRGTEQRNNNK